MCGIVGVFNFKQGSVSREQVSKATALLSCRGPDEQGTYSAGSVLFGHTRLRIIDLSLAGSQPMSDPSGRYTIIFNGEVYNFKEIRAELEIRGERCHSSTDTEVVLRSYMVWGEEALNRFNGFFAFAIHDKQKDELFLARDRFGIKPLLYAMGGEAMDSPFGGQGGWFAFASEMKALMALPISRELDKVSLLQYLHLNYIPAPNSIFSGVRKLMPGHFMRVSSRGAELTEWYDVSDATVPVPPLGDRGPILGELLEASVMRRLIADVPLGAFLSGGIDSSIIVALAAKHTSKLKTFSIGFPDNPFFNETEYANAVAEKYSTDHTVFPVTSSDLLANLESTLDYIDEPFADSSALLVNMLSRETREHVTVALSGDGGDELFAGYRKHRAEFLIRQGGFKVAVIKALRPLWKVLPKSRESSFGDKIRQLDRFAEAARLGTQERYWRLCGYTSGSEASTLLRNQPQLNGQRLESITQPLLDDPSFNGVLLADLGFILPNDMLHKVDLMSMAHGLEVRVPFLDHHVVELANSLPVEAKITSSMQKRIVKETFGHLLPPQLLTRPKQGFELPLLAWLRQDLKPLLDELLRTSFLEKQGLFDPLAIAQLRKKLNSLNPGDAASRMYGLLVFQHWWRRHLS